MTTEQATKIVQIMCTADGECSVCAAKLIDRFINNFPEYADLSLKVYRKHYDSDITLENLRNL